jgi:hypothetical protein
MSKIPDVQEAVRRLEGVATVAVRWPDPLGPATLHVEFAADADERAVTEAVLDTVRRVGAEGGNIPDIRIVETASTDRTDPGRDPRPIFAGMTVDRGDLDAAVEVALEYGARRLTGRAEGLATRHAALRTAAAAALAAVRELVPADTRLQLEWLEVVDPTNPGRPAVVQAAVTWLTRTGEETYLGSAFVRNDLRVAAVRATLDAINRRLARLLDAV